MVFKRLKVAAAVSLGLAMAGCQNVPDYLVEGRLPHFGKQPDAEAQNDTPPPVAQPAPQPVETSPQPRRHFWPQKRDKTPAPQTAEAAPRAEPASRGPAPAEASPAEAPKAKRSFWPSTEAALPSPLAGGFAPATDKKAVNAAVAYALHESPLYILKGVKSARTQVVAGTNYDLCLKVRQIDHEANPFHERLVAARVFQGLDGHYELTSWQEVNSCR